MNNAYFFYLECPFRPLANDFGSFFHQSLTKIVLGIARLFNPKEVAEIIEMGLRPDSLGDPL